MTAWKHKEWHSFKGTWYVVSTTLTDEQIVAIIEGKPDVYGQIEDWSKVG